MSSISGISSLNSLASLAPAARPSEAELQVKEKFQDFVAGTFYKMMLKEMRKMHDKPAYLHGGQAEDIFQGQLDQQVAEDLAHKHGDALVGPLYDAFVRTHPGLEPL